MKLSQILTLTFAHGSCGVSLAIQLEERKKEIP
jgi:hypothetical protein